MTSTSYNYYTKYLDPGEHNEMIKDLEDKGLIKRGSHHRPTSLSSKYGYIFSIPYPVYRKDCPFINIYVKTDIELENNLRSFLDENSFYKGDSAIESLHGIYGDILETDGLRLMLHRYRSWYKGSFRYHNIFCSIIAYDIVHHSTRFLKSIPVQEIDEAKQLIRSMKDDYDFKDSKKLDELFKTIRKNPNGKNDQI